MSSAFDSTQALPLASQSMDLVLLPHVLEFSTQPHAILREAERVLRPEGQIVITGFNPLSLWGVRRALPSAQSQMPFQGQFIGLHRLKDWLTLLGLELNGGRFGCYAPPFSNATWLRRAAFMEKAGDRWWPIAGAVYAVRAIKRVDVVVRDSSTFSKLRTAWRSGQMRRLLFFTKAPPPPTGCRASTTSCRAP
jgi:SAM-dependent methyltransferase